MDWKNKKRPPQKWYKATGPGTIIYITVTWHLVHEQRSLVQLNKTITDMLL